MRIGLVKEIKPAERRVALTESGVAVLAGDGHEVLVETGAGAGAGIDDAADERAGDPGPDERDPALRAQARQPRRGRCPGR